MSYPRQRNRAPRSTVQGLGRLGDCDGVTEVNLVPEDLEALEPTAPREFSRGSVPPPIPSTPARFAVGTLDGETPVPQNLGGYRVTGMLASGSMGVVYRGEHPTSRLPVAIKIMRPKRQTIPADVTRFFAEAVATARIEHVNVVRYYDFGHDERGAAYLVMELLEGETLASRLARERRLDVATAVDIATQIGLGLAAAHQQGVVHRDIKPDNIFLAVDRAGITTVKLLDFGVAKLDAASQATQQGDLLGTPSYMAPEQGLSASSSDERSDIYSVGCILFEMVCGVMPFSGNLVETLLAHQTSKRPSARRYVPEIPMGLDGLIDALLARDPHERPQSVFEVVRALAVIRAEASLAGMPPVRAGTERMALRMPVRWELWAVAFVALGIALGVILAFAW